MWSPTCSRCCVASRLRPRRSTGSRSAPSRRPASKPVPRTSTPCSCCASRAWVQWARSAARARWEGGTIRFSSAVSPRSPRRSSPTRNWTNGNAEGREEGGRRRFRRWEQDGSSFHVHPLRCADIEVAETMSSERVVFWYGCNAVRHGDIIHHAIDLLRAAGVEPEPAGGPSYCCGTQKDDKLHAAEGMAKRTVSKFNEFETGKVVSWCPSCYRHMNSFMGQYNDA